MELGHNILEGFTLGSILAGLAVIPVQIGITAAFKLFTRTGAGSRIFFLLTNRYLFRLVLQVILGACVAWVICTYLLTGLSLLLTGISAIALLTLISEWKFSRLGIHNAQLSVKRGTDYRAALNLCKNNFSFLGTGASKLSEQPNFEAALLRCRQIGTPVRLSLLSRPENPIIADAEQQAGVAPGTYKHRVLMSLRTLKQLHEAGQATFQVKFYKAERQRDFENFRMMFIDDEILLLSYNVYGRGGGRDTGQLVLMKSALTSVSDSFYIAYHNYFERLWSSADEWDFCKYVE